MTESKNPSENRLIVISNRLPLSAEKTPDGGWCFKMSSGGLVAALSGLKKKMPFIWIGWPGNIPKGDLTFLVTPFSQLCIGESFDFHILT
jgi:trehalose-6-phosphate synthase